MDNDPVWDAHKWVKAFFEEFDAPIGEADFSSFAANAADMHVREGASQIEWFLFTATFFEVAMRLYQEHRAKG